MSSEDGSREHCRNVVHCISNTPQTMDNARHNILTKLSIINPRVNCSALPPALILNFENCLHTAFMGFV